MSSSLDLLAGSAKAANNDSGEAGGDVMASLQRANDENQDFLAHET